MAKLINGKEVSSKVKEEVRIETEKLLEKGIKPGLAVVIVGNDPASRVYVNSKKRACEEVGFNSFEYALPEETSQEELLQLVEKLNNDEKVDGILCQLPLPKHIDENKVLLRILPEKDVDGFHPYNVGLLSIGKADLKACTPAGCIELIKRSGVDITGKKCVVVGRSNIVGKPVGMLLLAENGTVITCHSKTKDIASVCREADILVAAVGIPKFITEDMVSDGVVVIDVGINRNEEGKLCGDVDFESVEPKASYITPVPGGVGPMTIAMLMKNCLTACKKQNNL